METADTTDEFLTIEPNAFYNCSSLKEISFVKNAKIANFRSQYNYNISKNVQVIVPDELYESWNEHNLDFNVISKSKALQQKIENLPNYKIYLAIKTLKNLENNAEFSEIVKSIINLLEIKYNISINDFEKTINKVKII